MHKLTIAALLAAASFSISSHAQDVRRASTDETRWLSIPEVSARLESAGYRNIEKIEREGGSYEVKAIDHSGRRVKLHVHPHTGEVIDRSQRGVKHDKYENMGAEKSRRNLADCNERRCRDDLPAPAVAQPAAGK